MFASVLFFLKVRQTSAICSYFSPKLWLSQKLPKAEQEMCTKRNDELTAHCFLMRVYQQHRAKWKNKANGFLPFDVVRKHIVPSTCFSRIKRGPRPLSDLPLQPDP